MTDYTHPKSNGQTRIPASLLRCSKDIHFRSDNMQSHRLSESPSSDDRQSKHVSQDPAMPKPLLSHNQPYITRFITRPANRDSHDEHSRSGYAALPRLDENRQAAHFELPSRKLRNKIHCELNSSDLTPLKAEIDPSFLNPSRIKDSFCRSGLCNDVIPSIEPVVGDFRRVNNRTARDTADYEARRVREGAPSPEPHP